MNCMKACVALFFSSFFLYLKKKMLLACLHLVLVMISCFCELRECVCTSHYLKGGSLYTFFFSYSSSSWLPLFWGGEVY
ncbi:hypothetical protein V8C42DRAFT_231002 [Trichoderma barbatum]